MPLDDELCGVTAAHRLSLGVLLDAWAFLLESSVNAFSAFLLTDSNGLFAAGLCCAMRVGPDLTGEICTMHRNSISLEDETSKFGEIYHK
jgi:hypothetical protein